LTARLSLTITRRAAREIREASAWWDANRPAAPEAFRQAIATAFELISTQPRIGARATNTRLQGVRRIHLANVHYYLYYRLRSPRTLQVLALWHTSRQPRSGL
jgi:plasmid stabilization system protein ParE